MLSQKFLCPQSAKRSEKGAIEAVVVAAMMAVMIPMAVIIYSWGETATERLTDTPEADEERVWSRSDSCLERAAENRWFLESVAALTLGDRTADSDKAYDLSVSPNVDERDAGMDVNGDGDTADIVSVLRTDKEEIDETASGRDVNGDGDALDTGVWHLPSMPSIQDFASLREASTTGSLRIWKAPNHSCWEAGIP